MSRTKTLALHEFDCYSSSVLSENLRRLRRARGWSQRQLAKAAGVNPGIVFDVERGQTKVPSYDKVVLLARALEVTPDELCPVSEVA